MTIIITITIAIIIGEERRIGTANTVVKFNQDKINYEDQYRYLVIRPVN